MWFKYRLTTKEDIINNFFINNCIICDIRDEEFIEYKPIIIKYPKDKCEQRFIYDSNNRLTEVITKYNGKNIQESDYIYDIDGRFNKIVGDEDVAIYDYSDNHCTRRWFKYNNYSTFITDKDENMCWTDDTIKINIIDTELNRVFYKYTLKNNRVESCERRWNGYHALDSYEYDNENRLIHMCTFDLNNNHELTGSYRWLYSRDCITVFVTAKNSDEEEIAKIELNDAGKPAHIKLSDDDDDWYNDYDIILKY